VRANRTRALSLTGVSTQQWARLRHVLAGWTSTELMRSEG